MQPVELVQIYLEPCLVLLESPEERIRTTSSGFMTVFRQYFAVFVMKEGSTEKSNVSNR
jgi:hypothetical protein